MVMDGLGEGGKGKGVPHVIEPSVGLDRLMLAVLADAYVVETQTAQESGGGGGKGGGAGERVVLRLATDVAPVRAAVLPLKSNHAEMVELATQLQATLAVSVMTARPTLCHRPSLWRKHPPPSTSTFCFVLRVAVCASLSHPGCVCMSLCRPRQSSWLK